MSPILVRPVREQLEHDRLIRLLQAKYKRRHEVVMNVGDQQIEGVKVGTGQLFPDLVLTTQGRSHRLEGIVEVETGESVNHLEAMAQWAHFGRLRAAFYLYVPAVAADIARRLCADNQVTFSELWSYHTIGDQTRFTLVHRGTAPQPRAAAEPRKRPAPAAARPSPRKPARAARPAARGTKARSGRAAKPAARKGGTQKRK